MEPLSFIAGAATILGAVLAALNIREKLWPRPPEVARLEQVIDDIGTAMDDAVIAHADDPTQWDAPEVVPPTTRDPFIDGILGRKPDPCPGYRPDHNGECLNCDEPASEHEGEKP